MFSDHRIAGILKKLGVLVGIGEMVHGFYRRDGLRGLLQLILFIACCAAFAGLRSSLQADGLSDADALLLQGAALVLLLSGALITAGMSRGSRSKMAAFALRAVPICLVLFAVLFARTTYADVSIEIEALREARLPQGPGTRIVLGPTGADIRLSGEITEGAASRLAALLAAHRNVTRIHLTSDGGLADEGQALGDVIAAYHLTTFVPDFCVSACTLAFVRGQQRLILSDSRIGFHAPYQQALFGQIVQGDAKTQRDAYVHAGVAVDFADAALNVSSSDLWVPDPSRLIAAHVATAIVARDRLPDSSLDEGATVEAAHAILLRNFPILEGLDPGSRALESIAEWHVDAYRAGRSEADIVTGLRTIVGAAANVALAQADDATLQRLAPYLSRAMAAAPNASKCAAIGTTIDLVAAAAVTQEPEAAATLLRAATTPRADTQIRLASQETAPVGTSPAINLGMTCHTVRDAYAHMVARPQTIAMTLRPIVRAEAQKAAAVLAAIGRGSR